MQTRYLLIIIVFFSFLVSCNSGYQREDGKWIWVTYDEAAGKRVAIIDSVDEESFEVLSNNEYAVDKNSVFYKGKIIEGADPQTFEWIKGRYSRDEKSVYLDWSTVILAEPNSFKILEFPYSKDKNHVFCGTIPMTVDNIDEFKVVKGHGMQVTTSLKHFIEKNPEFGWLDTFNVKTVIYGYGDWAKGETETQKFAGCKEIKN